MLSALVLFVNSGLTMASLKDDGHQVLDHSGGKALLILLFVLVIVTNVGTFVFVRKKCKYYYNKKNDILDTKHYFSYSSHVLFNN